MNNKSVKILLIVLLSIVSVSLIIFMITLLNGNIGFGVINFGNSESKELILDNKYDINFEKVIINTNSSNVYFEHSTDQSVKVKVYGEKKKLDIDTNNSQLNIEYKEKSNFGITIMKKIAKITVYLPSDYDKLIQITNDYGDIKIAKYSMANIKVKASCGDINISSGKDINVTDKYGDIKIGTADNIKVTALAGDIEINDVNNVKVKNKYGNVEIDNVNNYLNIEDNCGDIKLGDVTLNKNSSINNDYGDVEIKDTNEIYIDADTDLGDTEINNNYRKSNITLKIRNNCGDIEVRN